MTRDRLSSISVHQLRVFDAVARIRSYAKAAEVLGLSQPGVSKQVKALESLLATRLVDRGPGRRPVNLTEAGGILRQACDDVFRVLEKAVSEVEALHGEETGNLALGADLNFGGYLVPRLHRIFCHSHPGVHVRLEIERGLDVLDRLQRHHLDLGIVTGPIEDMHLVAEPLAQYDMLLVGPFGHPLASDVAAPFSALAREPLILPTAAAPFRRTLDRMALETGTELNVLMEITNVEARIQSVASGLGVAPLSTYNVAAGIADDHLASLNVEGFPVTLEWFVVHPRGHLSPVARACKERLLQCRSELDGRLRKRMRVGRHPTLPRPVAAAQSDLMP